ncbi:MAG: YidC/Oxa1 family membrane protein insertase [Rhodospirillales bacterium]|nr:MAG: YidC/Oxa1 family membrane protein insertase [Rhodospirillales bacterium]
MKRGNATYDKTSAAGVRKPRAYARRGQFLAVAALSGLLSFIGAVPAWAIPSPDLAVNFLSSAGQILGLVSVTLGGLLFGRKQNKAPGAAQRRGGAPKWLVGGLALISVAAIVAAVLQWAYLTDLRNQRLEAALLRPSVEKGQKVGDTSLKTLSFSDQMSHPAGMTTEELAALLAEAGPDGKSNLNLIDLREPEEKEAGHLPQFAQVRYPDLRENPRKYGVKKNKTNVLLCFSGNRSSETCDQLKAKGFPCKFVVGGFEKWLTEGRVIAGLQGADVSDLRGLPRYENDTLLLDTDEVKAHVAERGAIFVDVRYPEDFETGHLPGAINMPLRKMTSAKMQAAFEALPNAPVIAPCYDKRSCFYAKILGLRLTRAGVEYLGRYTVPHEYFVAKQARAHVAEWEASRSKSVLDFVSDPLAAVLRTMVNLTGALTLAIFLVVLGLRLLVFPLTAKAERDQVVMRRIAPEIAEMKKRIGGDGVRLSRAIRTLNRRHKMTPGLNMIGIAIQIPLFLAFFFAVDRVAREFPVQLLWIPDMSLSDPYFVLPVLLGITVFLHLESAAAKPSMVYSTLRLVAALLLTMVTISISAAVNLYLVCSIGLMALQSMWVRARIETASQSAQPQGAQVELQGPVAPVCTLRDVAGRPELAGGKGTALAKMIAAGIAVPDGFVVTTEALRGANPSDLLSPKDWQQVDALWKKMQFEHAAVRSSGLNEDGEDLSYAGVFESVVNVDRDGLTDAMRQVYESFSADSASTYGHQSREVGAIVVQKMVDAEYAGVMFTEHPTRSGSILVELTSGLAVGVVDGTADASAYEFGRHSGQLMEESRPPIDLAPLLEIGRVLESLFGGPQDVEWAYIKGRFMILQSRAITALARKQEANQHACVLESERHRLLALTAGARADEPIFAQNELSELLPRPTPFSLALMEEMWQPGGTMDMACRSLGIRYDVGEDNPPFITSVFGALYVNRLEEQRRMRKSGGFLTSLRLTRMAPNIESRFWNYFVPALEDEIRIYELVELTKFNETELFSMVDHVCTRFITENYVQAHIINIAANFYFSQAERMLAKRGLPAAEYLANIPPTVVNRAMALLADVKVGRATQRDFIELFGHRAPVDYELADPRYVESPDLIDELVESSHAMSSAKATNTVRLPEDKALRLCIERAGAFQVLKEEAKHHSLRELAVIRRILLALGARLGLDDDIFYLTRQEIARLREGAAALKAARVTIEKRQEEAKIFAELPTLPSELTPQDLENLSVDGEQRALNGHAALKGELVAGHAPIRGKARVATGTSIEALESGEILITRFMHPTWAPALPRVAGVVTEVGGWLSHAAILAREYNVPTVVGARGVLERIATGDHIQLNPDGSIEII